MKIRLAITLAALLFAGMTTGCRTMSARSNGAPAEVRAILKEQERAWNAGDLAGFMQGYAKGDQTRFASGGDITLGWQTVFDRYQKKYGTGAGMGELTFSNIEISTLAPDCALAFGGWHLKRNGETFSGLFTLVFRKTPEGWRIVHDHTSSAAKP
jgi:ketosteroid isomerase-like protein